MSHRLSEVVIKNFRSCIDTKLLLSRYTPLIGYNNAGKSNALSAVHWLIRKSTLTEEDFFNLTAPIEVSGVIEGITQDLLNNMSANHRSAINNYISDQKLKIRRVQDNPNSKVSDIKISVWDEKNQSWAPNPNGIDNALKTLLPDPIRIGAMENAAEDAAKAKTSTTIGKLLAEFLESAKHSYEAELDDHLSEVRRRISSDGDLRFEELSNIDNHINQNVNEFFPGMCVKLHFDTPSFDELIKAGSVRVYEGQNQGRVFSSYGHGAQRSIQMAMIQYLADAKRGDTNQQSTTLLLIDEPELYLHPFAVEQVRKALLALSENGYQVLLSTHSPQMVTPEEAKFSLLIRKDLQQGTYARRRLADAIQIIVPNSVHQMEQLFSLSHSTQLLFSERVILTEGKTEFRLLPFIFENLTGKTLGQEKQALVTQGGVSNTKKSIDILKAMDLPTKAIVDLDYAFKGAVSDKFLSETDTDIQALRAILQALAQNNAITLSSSGLPQQGIVKPAQAYEKLASDPKAIPHINSLHSKLRSLGIWLWQKGAIEAHIGIAEKNELAWSQFKANVQANGIQASCSDYQSINDLLAWLRD